MAEDESIYRLFGQFDELLKKKVVDMQRLQRKGVPTTVTTRPPDRADDRQLLDEAMKDVRRLDDDKRRVARTPVPPDAPAEGERELIRGLGDALNEDQALNVTNLPEYMEGFVEGINPLTLEKLRSGEFSVQKTLDLHGLGVGQAHAEFDRFMEEAVRANVRCVKIIHGRGLKSKFGPVLKDKLKEWIVRAMHRRWVVAFASAKMPEGGPGATTVLLRMRPEKKRLHIMG